MSKRNWTREETILAFSLYCKTQFGKIHSANPNIIELASLIGRKPAAVSMKMCNFGRFDPVLKSRNVSGLKNGSKMDGLVWDEFSENGEELITEAEIIIAKLRGQTIDELIDLSDYQTIPSGLERERIVKTRINQRFFREALLSSYNSSCCITGINLSELLIASHIKPWSISDPATERVNPSNGLLLNAFHDKAFDKGIISINTSYEILVTARLSDIESDTVNYEWLLSYKGKRINLPEKFTPEKQYIEYHNDVIFMK